MLPVHQLSMLTEVRGSNPWPGNEALSQYILRPLYLINPYLTQTLCDVLKQGHLLLWSWMLVSPRVCIITTGCYCILRFTQVFLCWQWEMWNYLCNYQITMVLTVRSSSRDKLVCTKCLQLICIPFARASKSFKWQHVHSEVRLIWLFSTDSTAARLSRERACTYPAIVYTASFLFHLSTVCPPVPSLPPVSADLRISSSDDNSSSRDKWYLR